MDIRKIKPGILVSFKTSIRGGVSYRKEAIDAYAQDGAEVIKWNTTKITFDPVEHKRAKVTRSKCASIIRSVCDASTNFGLLCLQSRRNDLNEAIEQARAVARDFNATAQQTRVAVYIIPGEVASDSAEAIRSINAEVKDLLASMAAGVKSLDVKTIRDAANKARAISAMLSDDANANVQRAVATARRAARRIVKASEGAIQTVDTMALEELTTVRAGFLELGDSTEIDTPMEDGRAIELDAVDASARIAVAFDRTADAAIQIELEG